MKKEKFVIVNSAGLRVRGELMNYEKNKPVILLVHGFGGFMKEPQFLYFKKYFLNYGFAVCSFDFTNGLGKSDRDPLSISYQLFQEDLKNVLNWLDKRGIAEVAIIAHSMGGSLAFEYSAKNESKIRIASLICLNPFIRWQRPVEELDGKHRIIIEGGEKIFILKRWFAKLKVPYSYFQSMQHHDITSIAPLVDAPTLFVLGKLDKTTPAEYTRKFQSTMKTESRVLEYAQLGHTFFYRSAVKLLPEIALEIYQWIKNHEQPVAK